MLKTDNLPPPCAIVTKSGNLNFLEPSGPVQACNGTALPLPLPLLIPLLAELYLYQNGYVPYTTGSQYRENDVVGDTDWPLTILMCVILVVFLITEKELHVEYAQSNTTIITSIINIIGINNNYMFRPYMWAIIRL